MQSGKRPSIIGVVGPCGAGKSTLFNKLNQLGFTCRHIAQEHSYVADMWLRITNPDVLVFLDASFPVTVQRRKLSWTIEDYNEQHFRLRHARIHANLYLQTDKMSIQEVQEAVLAYLEANFPTLFMDSQ